MDEFFYDDMSRLLLRIADYEILKQPFTSNNSQQLRYQHVYKLRGSTRRNQWRQECPQA